MKGKGVFLHETDHWATPKKLYKCYMDKGFIDPCPLHCEKDNLNTIYKGKKIFINPPYSQISKWVEFIKNNLPECVEIHLLIPARTDTKYFHELLQLKPHIVFIKGRLHFNDTGCAPFPSIIMCFYNKHYKFSIDTYEGIDLEVLYNGLKNIKG